MEANVDPLFRGPDWKPITPKRGSFLHADSQGGFRSVFLEIDAFHRERRIPVRRGRSRHELEQLYIRFCFLDAFTADAFSNRFGGQCLTYAPGKPKPRTSPDASAVKREGGMG